MKKKTLLSYKQQNDWTCGPAILKVVLDYFGIKKEITELIKELKTTPENGTDNSCLIKASKKYLKKILVKKNSTLQDIKKYLQDCLVIVGYWIPYYQESHYSVVKDIDNHRIYLHDTWFGKKHSYQINYFIKNWWDEKEKRWLLAINKNQKRQRNKKRT